MLTGFESNLSKDDGANPTVVSVADLLQLPQAWWEGLRQQLELETGMELSDSRSSRLNEAVANAIRKEHLTFSELMDETERSRFAERVAAELTIGESFFLRNENHMRLLNETILPQILKENRDRREIRIWSAGCARGEEPYSLAILLQKLIGGDPWQVSILGTDLNTGFLENARTGWYRRWSFRQTQICHDTKFFLPHENGYQVRDHLRQQVRFSYLNLVKDVYPSGLNGTLGQDLILFRNVAIYLKPEVTRLILQRMSRALRPGGWLLLGEIEVALAPKDDFETHRFPQATIHRKPWNGPAPVPLTKFDAVPISPAENFAVPNPWAVKSPGSAIRVFPAVPSSALLPGMKIPVVSPLPEWSPLPDSRRESRPAGTNGETSLGGITFRQERNRDLEIPPPEDPVRRASLRLQRAQVCLQQGQAAQARKELEQSLRENPFCIEAYLLAGGLDEDAGLLLEAERAYRRALYLDRECVLVHFHLGLVLQQQKDFIRGRRSLKTALELCEKFPAEDLVEHGDGVCYGRLREMILMLMEAES